MAVKLFLAIFISTFLCFIGEGFEVCFGFLVFNVLNLVSYLLLKRSSKSKKIREMRLMLIIR